MKNLPVGKGALIALSVGAVLCSVSAASASFIVFDGDEFTSEANMFAEAGGFGSTLDVPTGSLSPFEGYSYGPSHAHNDGIGMATSSISQSYGPDVNDGGGVQGFNLSGHAGGAFQMLNTGSYSGESNAYSLFDATFSLDASAQMMISGMLSAESDAFPGSVELLSSVRLYEMNGKGESLIHERSLATVGFSSIDELLSLESGTEYRLEVLADVDAAFTGTIDSTHAFQADYDLTFTVIPAPSAFALFGAAGLFGMRRRRS